MEENKIIDKTLEIYGSDGVQASYDYLRTTVGDKEKSSQAYNFLYCLASLLEKKDEAIKWIEEAVNEKGMWYRPEVFEDEDLDNIRDDERFKKCVETSNGKYQLALKDTQSIFTWKEKVASHLLIALHGNQQNIDLCKKEWDSLKSESLQIEYLQSSEIDSIDLFRWSHKGSGPSELKSSLDQVKSSYDAITLGGFSAGCGVILEALLDEDYKVDNVFLQSPWIPGLDEMLDVLVKAIKVKSIDIHILCGKDDEDCYPLALKLAKALKDNDCKVKEYWYDVLGHEFPEDFKSIVRKSI